MSKAQLKPGKKRIIICCDGTWFNSDNGYDPKTCSIMQPSNVTRFARAVRSVTRDGNNPQIAYYQAGVGSTGDFLDRINGGATGFGLAEHIREAYAFITQNYNEGDQIILIGFSRGAFTARSIAGLIDTVGLLTRTGMAHFYRIFKDYENMNIKGYKNPVKDDLDIPDNLLPINRDKSNLQKYLEWLRNYINPKTDKLDPLTSKEIPEIVAIGVWDTVGSLGIPAISWLDAFKRMVKWPTPQDELRFYDTKLAGNVLNAFQALALDEMRYSFQPAVWEKPVSLKTNLKQVWFPGAHGNVGGGEDDTELQDISLAWMMSQMREACQLEFDEDYVNLLFGPMKAPSKDYRAWSCGLIPKNQNSWYYRIVGTHNVRTPGQYFKIEPDTGFPAHLPHSNALIPLPNTQERVHSSVRIRLLRNESLDINGKGRYKAEALTAHLRSLASRKRHGWTVCRVKTGEDIETASEAQKDFPNEAMTQFLWRSKAASSRDGASLEAGGGGFPKVMIEDPLGYYEKMLRDRDGDVANLWYSIPSQFSS